MTRQHFNILPRNICAVLLSVVLLLGGVGGRLCAQVLPRISGPTIIDAVQLYSEGNFTEALSALTKLIAANPSDDAAWYYKGLCEAVLNRNEDAKKSFSKAVELDGSNYWYRDRLATIYAMDGEEDLTIAQYEALLEEFPKKRDIHYSLIQLYAQTNQLDKALRSIDEVEAIQGKSDPTVLTKYRILLTQKKNEEALECLKSYVAEYSSPQVLSILGDYEMGMYNDTTAVKYYREALSLAEETASAELEAEACYLIGSLKSTLPRLTALLKTARYLPRQRRTTSAQSFRIPIPGSSRARGRTSIPPSSLQPGRIPRTLPYCRPQGCISTRQGTRTWPRSISGKGWRRTRRAPTQPGPTPSSWECARTGTG